MYNELIENALNNIGNEYIEYPEYYLTFNPLTGDSKSMSCIIYKESGNLKTFDIPILVKQNGVEKYTDILTITQWLRLIEQLKIYIYFVLYNNLIKQSTLNMYKEYIIQRNFCNKKFYKKEFEELRKKLYSYYILDIDILSIDTGKYIKIKNELSEKKKNVLSTPLKILECDEYELKSIVEYMDYRKLIISKNMYPAIILINNLYRKEGIALTYPNNYVKFRALSDIKSRRYLTYTNNGENNYSVPYVAKEINDNNRAIIVEGEIEANTLSYILDENIYAINNCKSVPKDLSCLDKYRSLYIYVDKDKFNDNCSYLIQEFRKHFGNTCIYVNCKIDCENEDINSLYIKDELTINDIAIENGSLIKKNKEE